MSILYHVTGEPGLVDGQTGPGPWDHLTIQEAPGAVPQGPAPFSRDNSTSLPINQRSSSHWSGELQAVSGSNPTRLLSSQKGRKGFLILVPGTAPSGVWVDSTEATLAASGPQGFFVAIGAALAVDTEDQLWAVSSTAGTNTQVCLTVNWG